MFIKVWTLQKYLIQEMAQQCDVGNCLANKNLFYIRFKFSFTCCQDYLATGWTTGRSRFDLRQRQGIFPLASVSRPALRPTQPPVQWVPGVKCGRGLTLTTHPLVPMYMSRSYTTSPPCASIGVLYDFFCFCYQY
jgi:hypothetical protein